jgi:hypothetical protein
MEKLYGSTPRKISSKLMVFSFIYFSIVCYGITAFHINNLFQKGHSVMWFYVDLFSFPFQEGGPYPITWINWAIVGSVLDVLYLIFVLWACVNLPALIIYFVTRRIKRFDLMNDRLEIIRKDNKRFTILLSDIESIKMTRVKEGKILNQNIERYNTTEEYKDLKIFKMIKIPLGKKKFAQIYPSVIYISRKLPKFKFSLLNMILPLYNCHYFLERAKVIALQPADPKEFFAQLSFAYEKWKQTNIKQN